MLEGQLQEPLSGTDTVSNKMTWCAYCLHGQKPKGCPATTPNITPRLQRKNRLPRNSLPFCLYTHCTYCVQGQKPEGCPAATPRITP